MAMKTCDMQKIFSPLPTRILEIPPTRGCKDNKIKKIKTNIIQGFHGNVNLELIFQIKDMDNSNDIPLQIYLNNF